MTKLRQDYSAQVQLLKPYKFNYYCTDDWGPYKRHLPEETHVASKKFTQGIERNYLTLYWNPVELRNVDRIDVNSQSVSDSQTLVVGS